MASTSSSSSSSRLLAVGVLVLLLGVVLVLFIIRGQGGSAVTSEVAVEPVDAPTVDPVADEASAEQVAEDLGASAPSAIRIDSYDPVEVREGFEAVAVKVPYDRAVASLPFPGDVVKVYRLPTAEAMDAANPAVAAPVDPAAPVTPGAQVVPPQNPPAELALDAVDVLGVIGPAPASNSDGALTLVLEVAAADVPTVMQLANDDELYVSLLPRPADAGDAS